MQRRLLIVEATNFWMLCHIIDGHKDHEFVILSVQFNCPLSKEIQGNFLLRSNIGFYWCMVGDHSSSPGQFVSLPCVTWRYNIGNT